MVNISNEIGGSQIKHSIKFIILYVTPRFVHQNANLKMMYLRKIKRYSRKNVTSFSLF